MPDGRIFDSALSGPARPEDLVQALERARRQNALILDSAGEGIIGLDLDGNQTFVNPAAARMLGYPGHELVGKNSHSTWHHTRADGRPYPAHECPNYRAFKDGQVHSVAGEVFWRKDGASFPVDYSSTPIRENGALAGAVVVFRDITERTRAEEVRKKLEEQLVAAQKMEAIGRLAGGVAHDFNNLLSVILIYSSSVLDKLPGDSPLADDIREVRKAGERAAALTRQLLAFSRRQILQKEEVDLGKLLTNTEKMLRRIIGEDITLETILDQRPALAVCDPSQIEQVIMNLVVNARDAMAGGGRLTIRAETVEVGEELARASPEARPGPCVCLTVEDSGTGMTREVLDHLFEPFFTTKGVGKGTGLGLSIVYGVVKQHSGWITVASEPGNGSTFRVYLPALSEEVAALATPAAPVPAATGNGERVLLVEDDPSVRGGVFRILARAGYQVAVAGDVRTGLVRFEEAGGEVALAFSDFILPDGTGLQLVEALRRRKPGLKVLLGSGYADERLDWAEIQRRGFAFIQKPYTEAEVLRRVRELLHPGTP